jgi:hypothetical protein
MILNGNPLSRTKVEKGDLCLRSDENGVDLNRNWDIHWEKVFGINFVKFIKLICDSLH